MAKRILILSSSPRKGGNSDTLCDEFLRGAKETGNEAEKIFLRDKKINYCTGAARVACIINPVRKKMMPQRLLIRWWQQMLSSWQHLSISTR